MERFFKYGTANLMRKKLDWHRDQYTRWLQERWASRLSTPSEVLNIMKYKLYREQNYIESGLRTKASLPFDKNIEPFVDTYLNEHKYKGKNRLQSTRLYYPLEEHKKLRAKLDIPDPANNNPWDFVIHK